jgi:undecaprenyl-diphosphatase
MIPAITASGLLELYDAIKTNQFSSDDYIAIVVGMVVAGIVGYLSIWFLLAFLRKRSTAVFIIYRIVVGAIILLLLWRGVLNPQV